MKFYKKLLQQYREGLCMRIMGLDVGSKTVGVAISDAIGWTAQGLKRSK